VTGATRLRLRVQPGARRAGVVGRHGDAWKVRVTETAERGYATEAVLELVADTLGLSRDEVTLVSGAASRDKVVDVAGLPPKEAERRLAIAGAPDEKGRR
jgi:uncharacterized protein